MEKIEFKKRYSYPRNKRNMPKTYVIKNNYKLNRSKILSYINIKEDEYYYDYHDIKEHLSDIEQTLIEYSYYDISLFTSLYLSKTWGSLKEKVDFFGKRTLITSYLFRNMLNTKCFKKANYFSTTKDKKALRNAIILYLSKVATDYTYAINNDDDKLFRKLNDKYSDKFKNLLSVNIQAITLQEEKLYFFLEFCSDCENLEEYYLTNYC